MARRQSIYVKGFEHKNPIPAACRIGNIVMSGIILGRDPATSKLGATLDEQCALIFSHMREMVEAAGGSMDDILKINVWMVDRSQSQREIVNKEWTKIFPDENSRPARQTMKADLDGGALIQCDFVAVLGG
jgi:enamine deaminase RidA (YjgF/YER057c/UK114 family)